MKSLLPLFLSLAACGSAFETGNLLPNEGGSAESHVDASEASEASDGSDAFDTANTADATDAGMEAGDLTEAASTSDGNFEASPEPTVEASTPPECTMARCVDGKTSQSCVSGTWGPTMTCPFVCLEDACTGVCVPGTTQNCSECSNSGVQTCLPNGTWGQCSAGC
jgi:hypothetical protein